MLKITFAIAALLFGVDAASDPSYDFKCYQRETGGYSCDNEGLQETLHLDEEVDLAAVSKIAKPFDLQIWMMQNMMRKSPRSFVPYVRSMKARFNGNIFRTSAGARMRTSEGVAAVQEYEDFLKNAEPVPQMKWSDNLMKACRDHVKDTGPSGATGHTGLDGSSMSDRIGRYMKWERTAGENIMYTSNSPLQVLTDLAIDDGVSSRGHRTNIFKKAFAYVGIYTGPHKTYGRQTVFDFSGSWKEFTYNSPALPTPSSYMSYKNFASPLAKPGTSAGGSTAEKAAVKKSDGADEKKKTAPAEKPAASKGGVNQNHWACNYAQIFRLQAKARKADVLTEETYQQGLQKQLKVNEVYQKKYPIADFQAARKECIALYRAGEGAEGKVCLAKVMKAGQAKQNYKSTKEYVTNAKRSMKYKRQSYTRYDKYAKSYEKKCLKYSKASQ